MNAFHPDHTRARRDIAEAAELSPARILHVFGMRRSGNHAVINWLLRNAPQDGAVFLNNCAPARDPLRHNAAVEIYTEGRNQHFAKGAGLAQKLRCAGKQPLLIASYEDKLPGQVSAQTSLAQSDADIVIYRSFLNWAASLYRKVSAKAENGPIWTLNVMMRSCHLYGQMLRRLGDASLAILYDHWFHDDTYRADTLARLGFATRDNSLGAVQRFGGGSSFQGTSVEPSDLQIDTRADQMADAPGFKLFLCAVAADAGFLSLLDAHFPSDAARLRHLGQHHTLMADLPAAGGQFA